MDSHKVDNAHQWNQDNLFWKGHGCDKDSKENSLPIETFLSQDIARQRRRHTYQKHGSKGNKDTVPQPLQGWVLNHQLLEVFHSWCLWPPLRWDHNGIRLRLKGPCQNPIEWENEQNCQKEQNDGRNHCKGSNWFLLC